MWRWAPPITCPAHIVLAAGDPLGFTHPLLRAAVYGGLPRRRKAALHRGAAMVLLAARVPGAQVRGAPAADRAGRRPRGRRCPPGCRAHASEQGVTGRRWHTWSGRCVNRPPTARGSRCWPSSPAPKHTPRPDARSSTSKRRSARRSIRFVTPRSRWSSGARCTTPAVPRTRAAPSSEGSSGWGPTAASSPSSSRRGTSRPRCCLPERAPDAHRRVDTILEQPGQTSSPAQRALMSKALIMRMYAGDPRDGLVALARELYAGGRLLEEGGLASQAIGHVAGALSYCDEYAAADDVLGRALEVTRRSGWVTWVGAASQLRARAAAVDGTDPRTRSTTPAPPSRSSRAGCGVPAGRRPLPDPRADRT